MAMDENKKKNNKGQFLDNFAGKTNLPSADQVEKSQEEPVISPDRKKNAPKRMKKKKHRFQVTKVGLCYHSSIACCGFGSVYLVQCRQFFRNWSMVSEHYRRKRTRGRISNIYCRKFCQSR